MWIIQTYNCCLHPLSLGNMHKKTILVQSGKLETSVRKTSFSLCISCTIWIFFFFYHVYIFLSKNKNFNTTKSKKKKVCIIYPGNSTVTLSKLEMQTEWRQSDWDHASPSHSQRVSRILPWIASIALICQPCQEKETKAAGLCSW